MVLTRYSAKRAMRRAADKPVSIAQGGHESRNGGLALVPAERVGCRASYAPVRVAGQKSLQEATDRMLDHLKTNQIDFSVTPLTLGPTLTLDPTTEQFTGELSDRANELATRTYREPFVVADQV